MSILNKKAPHFDSDEHLTKQTKEFLKQLNASDTPVESLSVADARKVLIDSQASVNVDLSGIEESEKVITVDNVELKLNIVRPQGNNRKLPVFIFIHGGGWVLGDYPTHRRLVRDLVVASDFACVFINYSPSPEAKWPQAVNEVYAATKWVGEHGDEINVDGSLLGIVGNSAGGNMAVTTCLKAIKNNGPEIKIQALLWPVTDASDLWESFDLYGEERFLTASLMKWMTENYLPENADKQNIYLSPLRASISELSGLPPTLITVAENDILRDEGEAFGRKLNNAGVESTTIRFNGVIHDWGMLNGLATAPETQSLITIVSAELKKYLK